jgi:peptide/nickel transport system substrate-binding protein
MGEPGADPNRLISELLREPIDRRTLLRRAAVLGGSMPVAAAILAACKSGTSDTSSPTERSKTVVVASGADAVTLDPGVSFDGQSPLLWRATYDSLLEYDGTSTETVGALAETYEISPDGLTYTFNLRPNVAFTDGEVLDSAAVKLNVERQLAIKQGVAFALFPLKKIETPDDLTVVMRLDSFNDGFLSAFAGNYTVKMISPKVITDHKDDWAQKFLRDNMVGTGPYILESYQQADKAEFRRNPDYWRGWQGDHFDNVAIAYVHQPATEQLELQQGQVDIALFLTDDIIQSLIGTSGITVTDDPSFNLFYLSFNCKKGPTADVRVRQALSHGFDYDTYINGIQTDLGAKRAHGPIPSNFTGYDPTAPLYEYDVERAKQLLGDAGYPNGGFSIELVYEHGYAWKPPLAELFQSNMRDLGVEVSIQELSPSAWAGLLSNPDSAGPAFPVVWWPTLNTPFDYMWSLFHTDAQGTAGYNWGYYSNPKLDALLYDASAVSDPDERNSMYGRAQHMLVEDAPALFIMERDYHLPTRDDVAGFVFNGIYIETLNLHGLHRV